MCVLNDQSIGSIQVLILSYFDYLDQKNNYLLEMGSGSKDPRHKPQKENTMNPENNQDNQQKINHTLPEAIVDLRHRIPAASDIKKNLNQLQKEVCQSFTKEAKKKQQHIDEKMTSEDCSVELINSQIFQRLEGLEKHFKQLNQQLISNQASRTESINTKFNQMEVQIKSLKENLIESQRKKVQMQNDLRHINQIVVRQGSELQQVASFVQKIRSNYFNEKTGEFICQKCKQPQSKQKPLKSKQFSKAPLKKQTPQNKPHQENKSINSTRGGGTFYLPSIYTRKEQKRK